MTIGKTNYINARHYDYNIDRVAVSPVFLSRHGPYHLPWIAQEVAAGLAYTAVKRNISIYSVCLIRFKISKHTGKNIPGHL